MRVRAFNLETRAPDDVSALQRLFDAGALRAEDIVCVLGKTEGNGGRNDFTRALAMSTLEHLFAPRLGCPPSQVQNRVVFSFSGGTEGVVTPHMVVFAREGARSEARRPVKRLCVGVGYTRDFAPEEIGRTPQILETARALTKVIQSLQLDGPEDVHLVQMKGAIPSYTHEQGVAAARAGAPMRADMVYSRGASALGVGVALGEIPRAAISDDVVCDDWSLYSSVASCSAKPGLARTELLVFANSPYYEGDLAIHHGTLQDILDAHGVREALRGLNLDLGSPPDPAAQDRIVGVFAKSEADPRERVRGRRHTMLRDDDIGDTRYSRCVLSSVIASVTGDTRVYVSTRAEHHGPLGGGPIAIIARVE